jgi:N utilization substance protein A
VDIDLGLLRTVEREKEIPFDELVRIIDRPSSPPTPSTPRPTASCPGHPRRARPQDRPRRRVHPLLDDDGAVIGEEESTPDDFGRIAAFAAKQVIGQRLRDIADDPCWASSAARRATSSPASSSRARTPHGPRRPRHRRGDPAARGAGAGEEYPHGARCAST